MFDGRGVDARGNSVSDDEEDLKRRRKVLKNRARQVMIEKCITIIKVLPLNDRTIHPSTHRSRPIRARGPQSPSSKATPPPPPPPRDKGLAGRRRIGRPPTAPPNPSPLPNRVTEGMGKRRRKGRSNPLMMKWQHHRGQDRKRKPKRARYGIRRVSRNLPCLYVCVDRQLFCRFKPVFDNIKVFRIPGLLPLFRGEQQRPQDLLPPGSSPGLCPDSLRRRRRGGGGRDAT